jgi:spore germination protein GerM
MAVRRTSAQKTRNFRKKTPGRDDRAPVSMIFWVLFFIVLIAAFFMLLPKVRKSVNIPPKNTATEQPAPEESPDSGQNPRSEKPPAAKPSEKPPVDKPPAAPAKETPKEKTAPEKPPVDKSPGQTASPPKAQQSTNQSAEKPAETRDRTIYFMREDGADMLLTKVNRKLKVSDSPMLDSLNALLAGPSAEEKKRGLVSFVPSGTRLISAQVRQNTAYLNFNEEFRYNTLGREGSAAQLKQIVWTATEFPNVHDVQIQIEGQTVDFLMEGIIIRNPIGRN